MDEKLYFYTVFCRGRQVFRKALVLHFLYLFEYTFVKPIQFLGDSLRTIRQFPIDIRHDVGYQLDKVQRGDQPDDFKPMPSIGKGIEESGSGTMKKDDTPYASVWDALADTPEQAANLRTRAELMQKIAAIVKDGNWTQAQAASQCGITQPRMNDLLRGRVSRFSLDALVNIATAIGWEVHVELKAA